MRNTSHRIAAAALALALAWAGGAAAEPEPKQKKDVVPAKQKPVVTNGAKVIALQAWVENLTAATENRVGIAPTNEPVPVNLNDRLRVRLVGTMIEADGDGVEIPIQARFSEAPGTSRLDILERGDNWVVVRIGERDRLRNDDRAQLAFEVTGRYDIRNNMREGRITFDLGGRGSSGLAVGSGVNDRDRWRDAERMTSLLYDAVLRVDPAGVRYVPGFQENVEEVYRLGYEGIVQVALELAREAQDRNVYRGVPATEVVGRLYRLLLGRSGSDSHIAGTDPGFAANVRTFERGRFYDLIDTFVRSEEFHRVHDLAGFNRL